MKIIFNCYICTSLLSLFFFSSCTNSIPTQKEMKIISVDSLNTLWNNAWNKHDSSGVVNLIAKDAILITGRLHIKGVDSISTKFVHFFIGKVTDMQTKVLQTKSWTEGCYLSGTYVFQTIQAGKIIGKEEGVYTFIWEKQTDNTMKLAVLHMEEYK